MQSLNDTVYWIIGFMILTNLGVIVTVIGAAVRGVWWLSKLESRVERNRYDINNAHEKIRDIGD